MPKVTGKTTKHTQNGAVPTTAKKAVKVPPKEPLWRGPEESGVTQSLIGKFLNCRERFRLLTIEGLKEREGFSLRLEYGNMIHVCEEATAAKRPWEPALLEYCKKLVKKFGNQDSQQISHWYEVCRQQYPVYLKHWKKNPDVVNRKPIAQEETFDEIYVLPSGRKVRLRGKFDAVDSITKLIFVQENKAKGDIKPDRLINELPFDLQSNTYLTAAMLKYKNVGVVGGYRYNVLRRPLSGGKYTIKQHEGRGKAKKGAETPEQFYARLGGLIASDPEFFFYRWKIDVTAADIKNFQTICLNPILEQLWDWWTWIKCDPFNPWRQRKIGELLENCPILDEAQRKFMTSSDTSYLQPNCIHWMHPTGVYNPTAEGRSSPYDEFMLTKSDRGLYRTTNLFPELEESIA